MHCIPAWALPSVLMEGSDADFSRLLMLALLSGTAIAHAGSLFLAPRLRTVWTGMEGGLLEILDADECMRQDSITPGEGGNLLLILYSADARNCMLKDHARMVYCRDTHQPGGMCKY